MKIESNKDKKSIIKKITISILVLLIVFFCVLHPSPVNASMYTFDEIDTVTVNASDTSGHASSSILIIQAIMTVTQVMSVMIPFILFIVNILFIADTKLKIKIKHIEGEETKQLEERLYKARRKNILYISILIVAWSISFVIEIIKRLDYIKPE